MQTKHRKNETWKKLSKKAKKRIKDTQSPHTEKAIHYQCWMRKKFEILINCWIVGIFLFEDQAYRFKKEKKIREKKIYGRWRRRKRQLKIRSTGIEKCCSRDEIVGRYRMFTRINSYSLITKWFWSFII